MELVLILLHHPCLELSSREGFELEIKLLNKHKAKTCLFFLRSSLLYSTGVFTLVLPGSRPFLERDSSFNEHAEKVESALSMCSEPLDSVGLSCFRRQSQNTHFFQR
jgi:hypothetical protein